MWNSLLAIILAHNQDQIQLDGGITAHFVSVEDCKAKGKLHCIVLPTIKRSAWFALSANVLQAIDIFTS